MHIILTTCGLADTGDELHLNDWMSDDPAAAEAEYMERLRRCREHVLDQADLVDNTDGMEWTDIYTYLNVWLEVPSGWVEPGDGAPDFLLRRSDDIAVEHILMVATGVCGQQGLKEGVREEACDEALQYLSHRYRD